MRELTGCVYFVGNRQKGIVKIGVTNSNCPLARIRGLQVGCPYHIELMHNIKCFDVSPYIVEKQIHKILSFYRLNGEWFSLSGLSSAFVFELVSRNGDESKAIKTGKSSWEIEDLGEIGIFFRMVSESKKIAIKQDGGEKMTIKMLEVMLDSSYRIISDMASTIDSYRKLLDVAKEIDSSHSVNRLKKEGGKHSLADELVCKIATARHSSDDLDLCLESIRLELEDLESFKGNATLHI